MINRAAAAIVIALLFAGCAVQPSAPAAVSTPPTPSGSASASPSPTWDVKQAAALAALKGYRDSRDKLYSDPKAYSVKEQRALLGRYAGYEMVSANVDELARLSKKGDRWVGSAVPLWTQVTPVSDGGAARGLEVHITVCQDYSAVKHLNAAGDVVGAAHDEFGIRQYSVRKPGKDWRVFGESSATGECHR